MTNIFIKLWVHYLKQNWKVSSWNYWMQKKEEWQFDIDNHDLVQKVDEDVYENRSFTVSLSKQ